MADEADPFALGVAQHRAGRLAQAADLYREALARDPAHVDALHFLGAVAHQQGEHGEAVALISRALSLNAANPAAQNNLGNALAAQGKTAEAVTAYLDALALQPAYPDAWFNLGNALRAIGRVGPAAACYRRALAIDPQHRPSQGALAGAGAGTPGSPGEQAASAHIDRGNASREQGRLDDAIAGYRQALALAPDHAIAHLNLGSALLDQGRLDEAQASLRRAIVLEPGLAEAHFNLGVAAFRAGALGAAKAAFERYLESRPDDRSALMALADACYRTTALDEAARRLEQVLAAHPGDAAAHNLLGNVRRNQGRHAEALAHYEAAIRHDRDSRLAFQNLLFCLMCAPGHSAAELHERHREFARRFEAPLLTARQTHANPPDPARRLRIGYVSPEFRANVVGHYIQPILEHHDRAGFEVHGFSLGAARDAVTGRLASLVDQWHDVHELGEQALAERIRSLGIDVLVDLCGHGPGNRILAFAHRPAPVQVSYLDYSATTGLDSIDYRLTTEYCDPTGTADRYYAEKLVRLGEAYWTYNPSVRREVTALPAQSQGHVTFGSFNLYYRMSGEVLELWARLLASVPGARLLIVGVGEGSTREALLGTMARAGVPADRLVLHNVVSYDRYHELMGAVDIALGPFPYNGATTLMDCVWNGLPVVSMQGGETFGTRLGCSVLAQLGMSEWIASDADDYVRIASRWAADLPALAQLRASLRPRLERSALRDFPGFTRTLERAYRSMWQAWCAARSNDGGNAS
ncbi:MAG TPA: tetratricopeptide repeat protein [Burkholderiales bacterium]|nr:tetratricopeptide repeat protein [Burkholderiales bacterium]